MEVEPDWGESEGEGERSGFRLASSSGEMEQVQTRRQPRGSDDGVVILNLAGVEVHGKRGNEVGKGRTVPSESWDDDFEFQHTTTTSKLSPSLPSLAYDASQSHSRTSKRSSPSHNMTPTHSRHASTSTSSVAPPPSNPLSLSTRQRVTSSSPQSRRSRPNSPATTTPLSSPVKRKKWLIYSTPADRTTFSPSSSTSSFPSPQVSNESLPSEPGSSAAFDSPQTTPRPFAAGKTVRREASEESTSTWRALPERRRRNSGFGQGKEGQKTLHIDTAMEEPNWDTSEPEADEANFPFTPPPRLKPIADGSPTPTRKSKWKMAIGMGGGMTNTVGSTSIFEGGGISGRRTGAREILGGGTTSSFPQSTSFPKSLATSISGGQFVVLGSRSRNLSEMDLERDEVGEPSTFGRSSAKGLNLSRSNSTTVVDSSLSDTGSSRRSSLQFVRPDVPHRNSSTSSSYRSRTTSLRKSNDNLGLRGEMQGGVKTVAAGEVTGSGTETEGESALSEEDTDGQGRRASNIYSSPPHSSSATDFSSTFPTGLKALNRSQVSFKEDLTFDDSSSTVRGKSVSKLKKKRRTSGSEQATLKSREGSKGEGEPISKTGVLESGQSDARTSIDGERRNPGGWTRSSMEQTARVTSPVLSPSRSQSLLRRVSGKLSSTKVAPLQTSGSDTISRRRLSLAKMMSKSSSDVPLLAFETHTLPKKSLRSNSSTSLQNIAPPSSSSQQQPASRKGHKRSSSSIGSAAGIFMSRARGLSIGRSTTVEPTTSVSESVITSRLEGSKNSNVLRGVPYNSSTNVPGNTNLSPISPRRPPVTRRQSKATPFIESPPELTVRQKRGHKSSFSLTSLSLNLRIFSSPPRPDSPTRPRTSMAIHRSNASFFDLDDDDLTERELMRRNSLSDLRIPNRITSSQKRIEEDLERVKEFARGIEQLKALREQYRQLIQMITSRPSSPIPQTDVVLVDDFDGPPLQVVQRVSHAIKRLEIDYQSWWEQVEALVNLGDGKNISHDSPKESPALLASRRDRCTSLALTQSSPSRGRGAPLNDVTHPTSEQAAAATRPIFQRAPSASSNGGESIEDRQREMLRGVLTSPSKSSSLPTRGPPSPRPTLAVLVPYLPRSVSNPNTTSSSTIAIPLPGPIEQPKSFLSYATSTPLNSNPLSAPGLRKVSRGGVAGIKDFLLRLKARASESEELVEKPAGASSKFSKPSLPSRRPTGAFNSPPGAQIDMEKEGSRSVSDPTSFVKGKVPSTPTRFFGRIKTEQITPTSQRGNQIDASKSCKVIPTMLVEGERTSPSSSEEEEDWDRDSPPRRDAKKLGLAPHLPSGSGIKRSMTMESGFGMGGNKERMVLTTEAMPELLKKVREVHARCEECIVRLKGLTV